MSASLPALDVLHVDNHVLALRKPAGVPSVPDASGDASLLELARAWIEREFEKPGRAFLGVVHRLDRPVSGVVVFARTSKAAARLSASFRGREVHKLYWGVAEGTPGTQHGELVEWLLKDERRNLAAAVREGTEGARRSVTRWSVLASERGRTLYAFEPLTGRAHQLRSAARALGTPLLGDLKYGAREPLPDASIGLHALALRFAHPTRAERIEVEASPPPHAAWGIAARAWAERTRRA